MNVLDPSLITAASGGRGWSIFNRCCFSLTVTALYLFFYYCNLPYLLFITVINSSHRCYYWLSFDTSSHEQTVCLTSRMSIIFLWKYNKVTKCSSSFAQISFLLTWEIILRSFAFTIRQWKHTQKWSDACLGLLVIIHWFVYYNQV